MNETTPESLLDKRELLALLDSGNQLNARMELHDVLTHILELAGRLSNSEAGSVILYDPRTNDLYFAAATGPVASELPKIRIPVGQGKAGQVFATGVPIMESNIEERRDHYTKVDDETNYSTESMICVPLRHDDKTYGVMQILNKAGGEEPYDSRDMEIMTRFAVQATIAIRNASVFEQMLASSGLYALPEARADIIGHMTAAGVRASEEKITILFADMRGFTQLCYMRDVEQIQAMLSDFLTLLSRTAIEHSGIVNKFLGDGMMAIFRGPEGAKNAGVSAFGMVSGFDAMRKQWEDEGNEDLSFLDIGIGIATDKVILGTIGNDLVRDFTVIGSAVNVAAAFEHEARGGRKILCDNLTYRAMLPLIAEADGPLTYDPQKPGQDIYRTYRMFHLKRIRSSDRAPLVFISHAHQDRSILDSQLVAPLTSGGIDVFYSGDTIGPGEEWQRTIGHGISSCDWFLVAVSGASVASKWVFKEVSDALMRSELEGRILPVVIEKGVDPADLHWLLRQINYTDLTTEDGPKRLEKLMRMIHGGTEGARPQV